MLQTQSLCQSMNNLLLLRAEVRAESRLVRRPICHEHDQLGMHVERPRIRVVDSNGCLVFLCGRARIQRRVFRVTGRRRWRIRLRRLVSKIRMMGVVVTCAGIEARVLRILYMFACDRRIPLQIPGIPPGTACPSRAHIWHRWHTIDSRTLLCCEARLACRIWRSVSASTTSKLRTLHPSNRLFLFDSFLLPDLEYLLVFHS